MTEQASEARGGVRRRLLLLLALLLLLLGSCAVIKTDLHATPKPDFAIGAAPASRSVEQGQPVTFTITVSTTTGLTGPVTLVTANNNVPSGTTVSFAPAAPALTTSSPSATSTMTLTTSAATPIGWYSIAVVGTGTTGQKHSVAVGLTVNRALSGSFSINATPASVSVAPGSTAVYSMLITRHDWPDPIDLDVTGSFPPSVLPALDPHDDRGDSATLQVATSTGTPDGTYALYVIASSQGHDSSALVHLVVDSKLSGKPFSLSGGPTGLLAPGVAAQPIDLVITNPNNQPLPIANISVTVTGTDRPGCTAADFAVTQYGGPYPLTAPKRSARSLSQLGVASSDMPTVRMLDLARNQDACKSAVVSLAYSGSAQGS
ncbi:MAG: hypothetical protein ACJ74O_00595 [Frankiaceae bacterium]